MEKIVFLTLCGEFGQKQGIYLNPSNFSDCNRFYDTKREALGHLRTHGGCDTGLYRVVITRDSNFSFSFSIKEENPPCDHSDCEYVCTQCKKTVRFCEEAYYQISGKALCRHCFFMKRSD